MPLATSTNYATSAGKNLRWVSVILVLISLGQYVFAIGTQAFFYEFNIWNWFFSSDVAYIILAFLVAVLLNCIGRFLREGSASSAKTALRIALSLSLITGAAIVIHNVLDSGLFFLLLALYLLYANFRVRGTVGGSLSLLWQETKPSLKSVAVIATTALVIVILGNLLFLPRPTSVVYPVSCTPATETDPTCVLHTPTYQHAFNVKQGRQNVISWTYNAVPAVYLVHRDCNVLDEHNWECRSSSGEEIFGEENGVFYEYGTENSYYREIYKFTLYTTKEDWEELNGGPEPITRRTTPLICYLTGEYCYGL